MPGSSAPDIARKLAPVVREALAAFRVVVVSGARQAGKTTLVRQVLGGAGTFVRLDDEASLQAARADPASMVRFGPTPRAFDEVQRAGDPLVRAIKTVVDDDPSPGQFILDGSADFLTVPTISESLAGRAAFLELWPFTQGEMGGGPDGFIDVAFRSPGVLRTGAASTLSPLDYLDRVVHGGFPEAVTLAPPARGTWFANYVRTVTQRDITELTGARRADQLPKLLRLLAARTASELIVSHIHQDAGLGSRDTTDDYIGFLGMTYLVQVLPAWSRNLTSKVKRHPKVHLSDTVWPPTWSASGSRPWPAPPTRLGARCWKRSPSTSCAGNSPGPMSMLAPTTSETATEPRSTWSSKPVTAGWWRWR